MAPKQKTEKASVPLYGVYGTGGFGREVMPLVLETLSAQKEDAADVCFIDDFAAGSFVNGFRVLSLEQFAMEPASRKLFNVAVAEAATRVELVRRCLQVGARPFDIVSRHNVSYYGNTIGEGVILCAYTIITSNARIGRYFHANIYSYVAHDCVIGDYVTFAPGVCCNGRVVVEDNAYIGTGAVIRNGDPKGEPIVIGRGAIVGMGAVVTRNVPAGATVVGNPARSPMGR